ncbi:signal-induced proliferation-associated 1-like protein 3 isoform X3 [Salvelinus fontinalis]|uniref:signal-induced proliferation-associated 1-like protein 3 isoform X3 n=1 Tax=Salvelinus fontinalis TaxID=8038 RepID=UPI0024867127|nr:signal-induced proliferation-associated 1-like protein 3 isoform X3 [Salvelinus fontinalis]
MRLLKTVQGAVEHTNHYLCQTLTLSQLEVLYYRHPHPAVTLSMMASYSPTHKGWFGERGVHQGIGLDILFSGRDFDTSNLYSQNGTQQLQEAKSHYACPRAPQRSLHGWGTYSPPPQRPSTGSRGGTNQCQGYYAHTLPLPHRALPVFRPCVCRSPQGYNTTTVDKPCMLRATITSSPSDSNHPVQDQSQQHRPNQQQVIKQQHQPSLSQKPVYQPSLSPTPIYRRLTTWQLKDNTNTDNTIKTNSPHSNRIRRQVDMTSQNVFGQPRVLASLRCPPSPRQTHKTTNLEEELRLIILDTEDSERDASCRHSLSSEISLGSGPLDSSLACSPVSDCPELEGLEDLSASELSLTEGWDPGHIPLLDPAWGLEWSNLVNAAKAYEAKRTVEPIPPSKSKKHGSEGGPAACPPNHYPPQGYNAQPTLRSEVPSDLSRLHHLEALLRHLESNLEKEREDKVALMEEVTILRETNQRLWEESLSSNEQLCKLSLLWPQE